MNFGFQKYLYYQIEKKWFVLWKKWKKIKSLNRSGKFVYKKLPIRKWSCLPISICRSFRLIRTMKVSHKQNTFAMSGPDCGHICNAYASVSNRPSWLYRPILTCNGARNGTCHRINYLADTAGDDASARDISNRSQSPVQTLTQNFSSGRINYSLFYRTR